MYWYVSTGASINSVCAVLSELMSYDFEKKVFDEANHELLSAQVNSELRDMEPGDIAYLGVGELVADKQRRLWVNQSARIWTYEEVYEEISGHGIELARVICINEGIIADVSHYDHYDYSTPEERFDRMRVEAFSSPDIDVDVAPRPVVYYAANKEELEKIEEILAESYNIVLKGSELDDIVNDDVAYRSDEDEREGW